MFPVVLISILLLDNVLGCHHNLSLLRNIAEALSTFTRLFCPGVLLPSLHHEVLGGYGYTVDSEKGITSLAVADPSADISYAKYMIWVPPSGSLRHVSLTYEVVYIHNFYRIYFFLTFSRQLLLVLVLRAHSR